MLIDFKFKNFLSYKNENKLLMSSVKSYKEHLDDNLVDLNENINLMKSVAVYGSNGGGKSNFISAFGFMEDLVHNSFANSLKKKEDKKRNDFYFKLSQETENKPSFFEISFFEQGVFYRYGFEILGEIIVKEWLYRKINTETLLFSRLNSKFEINHKSFKEGNKYKSQVNKNVLFLSYLAQNNAQISKQVFNWFENANIISGLDNTHFSNVTSILLREDPNFKNWLSLAVKFLEISSVESGVNENKLLAYHNKYDENDFIIDSVPFDIDKEESQGTRKLIYFLGALYDTLKYGKVLFIDEFDSKFHPNLTRKLISFFHRFNKKNAQFIFTAHDATLLDKDIFRRDQIWFTDKDQFGVSELYPMSSFDTSVVKNTSDFRKKYLESTFGGAESINIVEPLISFLYE